jgi:hypothetical protein
VIDRSGRNASLIHTSIFHTSIFRTSIFHTLIFHAAIDGHELGSVRQHGKAAHEKDDDHAKRRLPNARGRWPFRI